MFEKGQLPREVAPAPSTPLYTIKSGDGGFVVVVARAASSDTEEAGIAPAATALFALRSLASLPVADERVSPATPPVPQRRRQKKSRLRTSAAAHSGQFEQIYIYK